MALDEGRRTRRRKPATAGEETELNMTPMIDVVFQLIVFFLITLKFKTVDQRIDANLPKGLGPEPTVVHPPETPKVRLKVFRKHKADPTLAYTLVRVDHTDRLRLPADPRVPLDAVRAVLRRKRAALGNDPGLVCEIVAPEPDGGAVPEGDVIRLVDAIVQEGVTRIRFEGARRPRGR